MADYRTQPWSRIVELYEGLARERAELAPMRDLARRIAASPLAAALHPSTSHATLRLFAQDRFGPFDDRIEIDHAGGEFVVRYAAGPVLRPHALTPAVSHWTKRGADGFAPLERCLHHLRWAVEYREQPTRPVA
jgi:hypothetical protein